jgi:membrane fusion protein, multidrug efflux system
MRRRLWWLLLIAVAISAGTYWWFFHASERPSPGQSTVAELPESSPGPVATVKVARIKNGTIAEEITVYGTVISAAGATRTVAVSYESRVRRILVTEGQQVSSGDALVQIEPSPETALQMQQVKNDYESAQKAFQYMQQRFDLRLATNDQLLQTKQALEQAQTKLESLRRRGSEAPQTITADKASLISKVSVQEGAIVAGSNAMIEMVDPNRLDVRLGIEPADGGKVKPGQEISLARVNAPGKTIVARIRKLSQAANATTHLVDGFADLPPSSGFLLNESVVGKISVASAQGLIVPRSAVLPKKDHYVLFTVKEGHAQEHSVEIRLQNEREVELGGKDLQAGQPVVTLGNYELEDGMAVKMDPSQ